MVGVFMKRNAWFILVISSLILLFNFSACSQTPEKNDIISITDETDPINYLESKGYTILSSLEKLPSKTISKDDLKGSFPNGLIWSVQSFEPEMIIGKKVDYYCVNIKNHPLDKYIKYDDESIKITIFLSDDKIIGGFSSVNYKELMVGAIIYSIDGKTLEEFTGQDFQTWRKNWDTKYK